MPKRRDAAQDAAQDEVESLMRHIYDQSESSGKKKCKAKKKRNIKELLKCRAAPLSSNYHHQLKNQSKLCSLHKPPHQARRLMV